MYGIIARFYVSYEYRRYERKCEYRSGTKSLFDVYPLSKYKARHEYACVSLETVAWEAFVANGRCLLNAMR
jgi:hypothetical protein